MQIQLFFILAFYQNINLLINLNYNTKFYPAGRGGSRKKIAKKITPSVPTSRNV